MKTQLLKNDLNDITLQVFENISKKEIHELTDFDIAFLRSRRAYLDKDELKRYETVLAVKEESVKTKGKKVK